MEDNLFDNQEVKKPYVPGDFEITPKGSKPAVLVALIDLGTQTKEYNGERTTSHKIFLVWELVKTKKRDGDNHVIGQEYTLSFASNSNLTALLTDWSGEKLVPGGPKPKMTAFLGRTCMLTINHNVSKSSGRTYANVASVAPQPDDYEIPAPTHKPFFWTIAMPTEPPDFEWLPYNIGRPVAEWIKGSPEWAKRQGGATTAAATTTATTQPRPAPQKPTQPAQPQDAYEDVFPKVEDLPTTSILPEAPATAEEIEEIDELLERLELHWKIASKRCGITCSKLSEINHGQFRLLRAALSTELELKQPA